MGYRDEEGGRGRWNERSWGGDRDYGRDREPHPRGRDEERGFFERAGDEVRSWFGDDEAERRRDRDGRYEERGERGGRWGRPTRWSGDEHAFGGGWGNQRSREPRRESGGFEEGYGAGGFGPDSESSSRYAGPGVDAGFAGPRFDRADAGHTGTHGVHPVASATGFYGAGMAGSMGGGGGRRRALAERSQGGGADDPNYSEWRSRQLDQLDRDYDEYCRHRQSRFDEEFGAWRTTRERQRKTLGHVREHMEVVGSDGGHVGTVDKVRGDHIVLTRSDENAGGIHHSIHCETIDEVGDKVRLNCSAEDAMRNWKTEDRSRALFEREDQGSEGPHMLNRSFSGTYPDDQRRR